MPRKARPLDREDGSFRDASLIVIATEDRYAPDHYFSRFKTPRTKFVVIPTSEDGRSAPQHVLDRLDKFHREYVTVEGDTFWLCVDRDRWDEASLSQTLRECLQKGYGIALSNPCFELWVLLHYEELAADLSHATAAIKARLTECLQGYGTHCCRTMQITKAMVEDALRRAKALDKNVTDLIHPPPFTGVYKILAEMLEKNSLIVE